MSVSRHSIAAQAETTFLVGCGFVVAILIVVGLAFSFQSVDTGYVGVVTSFGKVQPDTLKPGLNFVVPFLNSVTDVDTRVRGISFGASVDDPNTPQDERFGAASKEYQDVFLQGVLNVHVDQDAAVTLFSDVGLDYDQKLVIPFFAQAIKDVVPRYGIAEVLPKREEIRKLTVEQLAAKLLPYGLIVDDLSITNIGFSAQYTAAVEAKQVAQTQVETEKQILAQRLQQAEQAKAQAKGEADARVIRATGNAEAALIEAEAQAEVNRKIAESVTAELIQYQLVTNLSPTIKTIILPDGQSFILDPKALAPTP